MKTTIDMTRIAGAEYARSCVTPHEGTFLMDLIRTHQPEITVEIGSWIGISTIYLAEAVRDLDPGSLVVTIDPHEGSVSHLRQGIEDTEPLLRENLKRFELEDVVFIRRLTSVEALKSWEGYPIDFLFLDGCLQDVCADFSGWSPFVPTGGIVVFHDYPERPNVRRAVDGTVLPSGLWLELGRVQKIIAFQRRGEE